MTKTLPWEKLGFDISPDASINAIITQGQLNWQVKKEGIQTKSGIELPEQFAIVRELDRRVFSIAGPLYTPVQNYDAMAKFYAICEYGYMKIVRAGAFDDGKYVWALAKMQQTIGPIQGYVLMCHAHVYGKATTFYACPLDVMTQSTYVFPLGEVKSRGRLMHSDEEQKQTIEETFNMCKSAFETFNEHAASLSRVDAQPSEIRKYLMNVFYPHIEKFDVLSENAQRAYDIFTEIVGSSNISWWSAFQAVMSFIDHDMGRDRDFSLCSAWFGPRAVVKQKALTYALRGGK